MAKRPPESGPEEGTRFESVLTGDATAWPDRGARPAFLVMAAVAVVAAVLSPVFRSPDGAWSGRFVVPLAVAVGAGVLAVRPRRWALWLGLLVAGQAVALQLVQAGPRVGYQHYVPWPRLLEAANAPWSLGLLALAALVVPRVVRAMRSLRDRVGPVWPLWRLAVVGLVFSGTSATLSRELSQYAGELALATLIQLVLLATVVIGVWAIPRAEAESAGKRLDAVLGDGERSGGFWRIDRFALLAAGWVVIVTALLAVLAYERHPHVPDEVAYLMHARYFADGALSMPLPPVPAAFDLDLMTYEATRWFSPVPPGWPAVLAVGVALGAPWLVNPVLSGVIVLLTYLLVRGVYDMRTARLTLLFLCTSPWFLFMGMNLMTHQLTLAAGLGAAVAVAWLRRGGTAAWAIPAGFGVGVLGTIRPLEGLIAALLLGLWLLGGRGFVARVPKVALMAASAVATAATTLPYNLHLTGRAAYFPIMAYTDAKYGAGTNALGFGPDRGLGWGGLDPFPGHGFRDVLVNTNVNAYQVNTELLGWGSGSLLVIALLLLAGRTERADRQMAAAIAAVIGAHAFYWFSGGPDFGARYWYLILVPCLVLTARGIDVLAGRFHEPADGARMRLAALALCTSAVIVFVPWRAMDKYHHYRGMRPDIRQLDAGGRFDGGLVLVRGRRHPDYASAAVYNPLDLRSPATVYAWDRDPEVRRLVLDAYRDRTAWIVEGPSITGDGYRIIAGPVPAERLLEEAGVGR